MKKNKELTFYEIIDKDFFDGGHHQWFIPVDDVFLKKEFNKIVADFAISFAATNEEDYELFWQKTSEFFSKYQIYSYERILAFASSPNKNDKCPF